MSASPAATAATAAFLDNLQKEGRLEPLRPFRRKLQLLTEFNSTLGGEPLVQWAGERDADDGGPPAPTPPGARSVGSTWDAAPPDDSAASDIEGGERLASQEDMDWVRKRTRAARDQGLLDADQCKQLCRYVRNGDVLVARDVLIGLGLETTVPWECNICFMTQDEAPWQCPDGHEFCRSCMHCLVDATPFPRCPSVGCSHDLAEADLAAVGASEARVQAFREGLLRRAVDSLGGAGAVAEGEPVEVLLRCQREGCDNVAMVAGGAERICFQCPCGAPSQCSGCQQSPYHFHADCADVGRVRQAWFEWLKDGRRCQEGVLQQIEAVRVQIRKHQELSRDERWKEVHCKKCPNCGRAVQKLEGCNHMVCGQDAHGGNTQHGCGAKFDWAAAERYRPRFEDVEGCPEATVPELADRRCGSFHSGITCAICGSVGFAGIRFRCIHCENFNVCHHCEPMLGYSHPSDHTFEIFRESQFDWSCFRLPSNTVVVIVRRGNVLPSNTGRLDFDLEGLVGVAEEFVPLIRGSVMQRAKIAAGERCPPGWYRVKLQYRGLPAMVNVWPEHVEPALTFQHEADRLIKTCAPLHRHLA